MRGERIEIDRSRGAARHSRPRWRSLQAELASAASAAPAAACRSPQGPFLRREDELRILQENLEAIEAGDVRIVCLTGEPGAGKTTLLEPFIAGIQAAQGMEFDSRLAANRSRISHI
jgi:hypothetical protein